MKRILIIILYISTMLLCAYLAFVNLLIIYMQLLGMKIIIFHPSLPFTDEYIGVFTIIPNIIQFLYILITGIYFEIVGYRKLKATAPNYHKIQEKRLDKV